MASVVKMGSALYLKFPEKLETNQMDELSDMQLLFQRSGGENFVFDLTALTSVGHHALNLLMSIQAEARKKGEVYILTPKTKMREELLSLHAIKDSEIYESRGLICQALREKSKGHIPV